MEMVIVSWMEKGKLAMLKMEVAKLGRMWSVGVEISFR